MAAIWKHSLFQVHQVLVTKICKRLSARRINIINGKSINSIYCPTAKDGKTYDFIDSEYKAQDDNLWWHRCNIIFDSREFLNVFDKDNITKISSRYTNKAWFHIMQSSQKHPRLEIGLREYKVDHQNMRRTKEVKKYKLVEDDLWIELDLTTITIELISTSSSIIQMTTRKVSGRKLL